MNIVTGTQLIRTGTQGHWNLVLPLKDKDDIMVKTGGNRHVFKFKSEGSDPKNGKYARYMMQDKIIDVYGKPVKQSKVKTKKVVESKPVVKKVAATQTKKPRTLDNVIDGLLKQIKAAKK